jgi:hypothetical protein
MKMTSDQQVRVQILSICEGRVSEAKQAYYWVMGDQGAGKAAIVPGVSPQQAAREAAVQRQIVKAQEDRFPLGGVSPPVNVSREQQEALQRHAQTEAMLLAQGRNERNPYIGGSSD